jgi:hypothetical protein
MPTRTYHRPSSVYIGSAPAASSSSLTLSRQKIARFLGRHALHTLKMACEDPCNGCVQQCDDNPLPDIENYAAELERLRARTKELETLISKHPADQTRKQPHPYRSAEWFQRTDSRGITLVRLIHNAKPSLAKKIIDVHGPSTQFWVDTGRAREWQTNHRHRQFRIRHIPM